jgi:AraC-like DNA-binding protein
VKRRNARITLPLGNVDPFIPTRDRPVRSRARPLEQDTHIEPHQHAWAQLAYCASGLIQVTVSHATGSEATYIVPPSRALWIPPDARHAVTVLEAAELCTLYIDASVAPTGWTGCHVLVVSPLLRELIHAVDAPRNAQTPQRMQALTTLLLDDLVHADTQALGVPLPRRDSGDRRLRALCEAVLRAPTAQATLADWAADTGASERTMARLFREELGTSYQQWRQQVLLAHALPMLVKGLPVSQVAAACGYASDSAFSAMFKAAMGQAPSRFALAAAKMAA